MKKTFLTIITVMAMMQLSFVHWSASSGNTYNYTTVPVAIGAIAAPGRAGQFESYRKFYSPRVKYEPGQWL